MNVIDRRILAITRVFPCESGRWLALSPADGTAPRIGVLAATEEEARANFEESMAC
jgi:hypothetical protein